MDHRSCGPRVAHTTRRLLSGCMRPTGAYNPPMPQPKHSFSLNDLHYNTASTDRRARLLDSAARMTLRCWRRTGFPKERESAQPVTGAYIPTNGVGTYAPPVVGAGAGRPRRQLRPQSVENVWVHHADLGARRRRREEIVGGG
jgi:hypothetical protein